MFRFLAGVFFLVAGARVGLAQAERGPWQPEKLAVEHLPNALQLHNQVLSGGHPGSPEAFRELQTLGVKTVISVDGAKPDVALARQFGLRYVHLPHGYDGISEQRAWELAKAVRDLPGPIYIHCHHGKHRSPAAAAVACIGAGLLRPQDSITILRTAGTNEGYRGLYESANAARRLDDNRLDELEASFPETAEIPPLAAAMLAIERVHEHLLACEQADWNSPGNHPDLDPAHEALLLREQFTELLRTDATHQQPAAFRTFVSDSENSAAELEAELRNPPPASDHESRPQRLSQRLAHVTKNCKSCHQQFRDVPLSQKPH